MTDANAAGQAKAKPGPQKKYDYSQGPPPLDINLKWCKACNICIALCPQDVFEPDRDGKPIIARPENCTQCTICWVHCPDLAITSNYK
jgi:2-oxoglutarate ferredoxin oxidoreductase subunit delta